MKKSVEIIGFPIISIAAGEEIGKVKSIVVNPDKGSVDFLTVEHKDWEVSVKAIPFQKIIGIGKYAVTVESFHSILDLNEIPIANQLINKKVSVNGAKVMTRVGELVGEVQEFYVNEKNGNILSIDLLSIEDQHLTIDSEHIVTYGEQLIILNEEYSTSSSAESHQIQEQSFTQKEEPVTQNSIEELDRMQEQLLEGKQATKDILGHNGETVVQEGTIITEGELKQVKEHGPSLMVELSMNVK